MGIIAPIMDGITPKNLNEIIATNSFGIGIDAILGKLGRKCSRRTLQRKLDELAKAGQIERVGKARATKYRPVKAPLVELPEDSTDHFRPRFLKPLEVEFAPSVVREGPPVDEGETSLLDLQDYFREHYSLRKPTGYRREFLDSYLPNVSTSAHAVNRQKCWICRPGRMRGSCSGGSSST
jgi:hypothetical protein